jgi:chemotaxis protein MotB
MAKRKEEPEKENSERWLLTYSDMITLLMLFFIVLYSMSTTDTAKYAQLSESLAQVFNGGNWGLMDKQSGSRGILEGVQKPTLKENTAQERKAHLMEDLKRVIRGNDIKVTDVADGISLTLFSDLYFGPGKAEISEEGYTALRNLAPALLTLPNNIRIEGSTDSTPVDPHSNVQSNWDLSAQRALTVLKALESYGIPGERLSALALGSTHPQQPNDTPEGRSYNRRVDIIILFK